MNTGAHDAGGGFTQSVGTNAARGIGVILAAVLVGLGLMALGYSDSAVVADAGDSGSALVSGDDDGGDDGSGDDGSTGDDTTVEETTTTTQAPTTTTTEPAPVARPAADVTIVVLNAADGKPGIAGRTTGVLEDAGYASLTPRDAGKDQETAVQYVEGYEGDAIAVAAVFGLDESVVEPFPADPNIREDAHVDGAQIVVFVGLDNKIDL